MQGTLAVPTPHPTDTAPEHRLRIAYAIDSLAGSGGTELHAVRLAELMVRSNATVRLVTLRPEGEMGARYEAAGIEVTAFPVSSLIGRSAARQVRTMAETFKRERIDVVHSHDCYTNFLATLAGRAAGVPLVIASKRWTKHLWPQHAWTNRIAFRAAHLVVANSSAVAETVHRDEWVAKSKIRVTPNFLDDHSFDVPSSESRRATRESLGFTDEHVVFAILAHLRVEKDHAFLLRAFARVSRKYPLARLLVVGDGPLREPIERQIADLGLQGVVLLAGHAANPRPFLAAADVLTLTSQHEGFPNALLEGMALGRPVVSTAAGGVVDAVREGETGFLSPIGDLDAFVGAMLRMSADETLRRRLGAAARSDVQARFRASTAVASLEALYRSHLSRSDAR